MQLFTCRVCREKDARISDLKEQIESLKQQVLSPNARSAPALTFEADGVLSGQQHVIDLSKDTPADENVAHYPDEQSERDRLFAGTY
jgi:hypothetical protein